jgi:Mg2+ and Co2+ transporter CorA
MLPLTLVTGFFGMNIEQAQFSNNIIITTIIFSLFLISIVIYYLFRGKRI